MLRFSVSIREITRQLWLAGLIGVSLHCACPEAKGIVFANSADPDHNTTAPTATYADSGWQFQGEFGVYTGTAIADQFFITAQHFGVAGSTFVQTSAITGGAEVVYTIDATSNSGLGYWDIAGSDLRVYKINETFGSYATLFTGPSELGLEMITFGRSAPRGDAVTIGPTVHGWATVDADGVLRWGTNTVSGTSGTGAGTLFSAQFNALGGPEEASLAVGDSGGGVFVFDGVNWLLAGVNYGVDGSFDRNNTTGDGKEFDAAMLDRGGFYQGSDAGGWTFLPNTPVDLPSSSYFSSISANAAAINSIITAPEPNSALLCLLPMAVLCQRRRRGKSIR
ncbi:MAG: hypothetical protein KDK97_16840 [Verrucomicrobiales bacterium]|nr:hypothetical protein [Verrucomicrobiales bacterium]MCP5557927.1 hypothetical protein [Verrucomicrobiaceae bacterium]